MVVEFARVWELGHNLGMQCAGDEGSVVRELDCMEERDNEVKKGPRVGKPTKLP